MLLFFETRKADFKPYSLSFIIGNAPKYLRHDTSTGRAHMSFSHSPCTVSMHPLPSCMIRMVLSKSKRDILNAFLSFSMESYLLYSREQCPQSSNSVSELQSDHVFSVCSHQDALTSICSASVPQFAYESRHVHPTNTNPISSSLFFFKVKVRF